MNKDQNQATPSQQQNQPVPPSNPQTTQVGVGPRVGLPNTKLSTAMPQAGQKLPAKGVVNFLATKYYSLPKNMRPLVLVGVGFLAIIFVLLIASLAFGGGNQAPSPTPTATPVVTSSPLPQVSTTVPSRYATDSAVLKIESDVNNLNKDMDSVDLRQSDLRVPTLDFTIKFN